MGLGGSPMAWAALKTRDFSKNFALEVAKPLFFSGKHRYKVSLKPRSGWRGPVFFISLLWSRPMANGKKAPSKSEVFREISDKTEVPRKQVRAVFDELTGIVS